MALKKITFSLEPATQLAGSGDSGKTRPVKGDAAIAIYNDADFENSGNSTLKIYYKEPLPNVFAYKGIVVDIVNPAATADGFYSTPMLVDETHIVFSGDPFSNVDTRQVIEVWYEE